MSAYIQNLKQILQHLVLLYKNFLHWNISKIAVFFYANILGFVLSLPFVGVIAYQYFSSYSQLGMTPNIETFILGNIGAIILTVVLILCMAIIFIATYTYGNFLMMNVYKSYLQGDALPYRKNLYFSWKHFRAYMGILGWIALYMLAPIALWVALIVPMGMLARNATGATAIVLTIASLIVFILLFVWLVSLVIRLAFSYYGLLYSEDIGKAKSYIDESLRITKGKVWKIIFRAIPFLLVLGIITSIAQTVEQKFMENRIYTALIEIQKQSGQDDHKLLEGFFVGNESPLNYNLGNGKEDFKNIESAFEPMAHDINRDFLSASLKNDSIDVKFLDKNGWIFTTIFVLFSFLILDGLTSMLYLSIYHMIVARKEETVSA